MIKGSGCSGTGPVERLALHNGKALGQTAGTAAVLVDKTTAVDTAECIITGSKFIKDHAVAAVKARITREDA